jgi:transketolase
VRARVVSFPSFELFDAQPEAYRQEVLPPDIPRIAVEAGATRGWHEYVGDLGAVIGLDRFGASAPGEVVMREMGFTPERVVERAMRLLGR